MTSDGTANTLESRTPLRVAIVEDDLAARNMLVATLQADADYTVVAEFAEGRAAVSAIPHLAPDMVLVDLGLPNISGNRCHPAVENHASRMRCAGRHDIWR